MACVTLQEGWRLTVAGGHEAVPDGLAERLLGEGIPALVPGCVHTDLMAAGLIPDPYIGFNEKQLQWIGHVDWRYSCCFGAPEEFISADRIDLVCEGLDTIARIELNGTLIGRTANMHVGHRIDAREVLRAGENELSIVFTSALNDAAQMERRIGVLPNAGKGSNPFQAHNMIRKMACNFGWDWGPVLVTAGIWRPIYLEAWSHAHIKSVRPLVILADPDHATVDLRVDTQWATDDGLDVGYELRDPDGVVVASSTSTIKAGDAPRFQIDVQTPQRWWPVGHGGQPLYTLCVKLNDSGGHILDEVQQRIGLRVVELDTSVDDDGRNANFCLKVNGKRVYCKGANWIPDDCFPHRVTPERYRERITQAHDANMNMLRVWGGGIYESDIFYDICDELGVMVWQDFALACACYPQEEPFRSLFEDEARYNITRLVPHPSLVLWNGGNECIWATFDEGGQWEAIRTSGSRTWGLGYYLELFPGLIRELDPSRPYWPNSPYSGSMDIHPNKDESGNAHVWDVWNGQGDYRNYFAHRPRFASEFGFHGPPTWPTLEQSVPPDQWRWDSEGMIHHNRHQGGQELANARMADYFDPPDNFDDWLYLAQLNQVRALTLGCEWFRALSPWNSGTLYWQLNDCWPVASWSAIDSGGRRKPLWYATRRSFAGRLITIQPCEAVPVDQPVGPVAVYLHNDHDEPWIGECVIRLMGMAGQTLDRHVVMAEVDPRGSQRLLIPSSYQGQNGSFLVADLCGSRSFWFPDRDKDMVYPAAKFDTQLGRDDSRIRLTITAHTLLRDLAIFPDRLDPDAVIDDQVVTLLPGECYTFTITTRRPLTAHELTTRPVLQMANYYGK
jgi:beta-mannosidase